MTLHIGLDYDDTASEDPDTWGAVVAILRKAGHKVTLVTVRPPQQANADILAFAQQWQLDVVFTNGRQKAPFMEDILQPVDIWIDDAPAMIPSGTTLLGTAIGCLRNQEPVDPERTLPGRLVFNKPEIA